MSKILIIFNWIRKMNSIKFTQLFLLLIFLSGGYYYANVEDESWKIFDDTAVGEVRIIIEQAYLEFIMDPENAESDSLFPATFIYKNSVIQSDTLYDIGFRIRGNTSRGSEKKSFKVDINHFVSGRQFYDLEKINLNGEHNDPSIIRSKLCWDLFNLISVPATRANHVTLYINNEYMGLYINVEHIDDEFVQKRFGNQIGNLYKCLWPADLIYLGQDQEVYKEYHGDRRIYDLKTNKQEDDYSDLVHFIDVLNNTPQNKFKEEIKKVFNVENFLKWLAMDVLLGSWDDYWFLKNNYYLYNNPATGKFEFIPYDYDNTYGIDWVSRDWGTRNIYNWGSEGEERPLVTGILSVPEYRNIYTQLISDYMDNEFAFEVQEPRIDKIKAQITPAAEADIYRTFDWDFTIADFHKSYTEPVPTIRNHVPYGLKPYITTRISTAKTQLNFVNMPPTITQVQHSPQFPESSQTTYVTAKITDDDHINSVKLYYGTSTSNLTSDTMYDDGNHNDGNSGDNIFGVEIAAQAAGTVIYYYIEAKDDKSAITKNPAPAPDDAYFYISHQASNSDVLINLHFKKSLRDSDVGVGLLGSFNDWIKIYPMDMTSADFWEVNFYLPRESYIYKFVTYQNLNDDSGVTEWIADPENPESDGHPYYNAVLNVTDPMIYYIKPLDQDTVETFRPEICAEFTSSQNTSVNSQSIVLKIDNTAIENANDYYDPIQKKLSFIPPSTLAPGQHTIFLSAENSQEGYIEVINSFFIDLPLLFINEFLARNDSIIADEADEYEDWVEIYNGEAEAVSLGGMYLTDNFTRTKRWKIPDITIESGGFLLIWADNDQEQGPLHTNFKLSGGGEQIGLYASDAIGNFAIDTLSFGEQTVDISYGRYADGNDIWGFMQPTPGEVNSPVTGIASTQKIKPENFEVWQNYPNPFNLETKIRFGLPQPIHVSLKIYNISGQLIKTCIDKNLPAAHHTFSWNGRDKFGDGIGSGIYFYQLKTSKHRAVKKMILLR